MKKVLIVPSILILSWYLLSVARISNSIYFPDFFKVFMELAELVGAKSLYNDLLYTLFRTYIGFGLAALLGTWIGFWLGIKNKWYKVWEFPIDFFRAIPSPVLFPLAILIFGIDEIAKIFIVFYTCFFINIIYAYYGARDVEQTKQDFLQSLRTKRSEIVRKLIFWAALPRIFSGLRITLTIAFILVVITEMLGGAPNGLGVRIYNSSAPHMIPQRYALILILGTVGYFINKIFVQIENKIIHWRGM